MAYNAISGRLIVFGGEDWSGSFRNDLWVLANANGIGSPQWIQLMPDGAAGSPPPRLGASTAYDEAGNRLILFGGGFNCDGYDDVWVLNNADGTTGTPQWSPLTPLGPGPDPRVLASGGYDPGTNRLIVALGQGPGCPSSSILSDAWVLTNANGTEADPSAWIQLTPSTSGPAISHHASAYDATLNTLLVYGGYTSPSTVATSTWILTHADGLGGAPAWTEVVPSGAPGPSIDAAFSYDDFTRQLLLFGGSMSVAGSPGSVTNRTFTLASAVDPSDAVWNELPASGSTPSIRGGAMGAYDRISNRFIVFGGTPSVDTSADVWVLTNANGADADADTDPPIVTCATPDNVWHPENIALPCTASDGGSGLLTAADASFTLVTNVAEGVEDANASTDSRNVCDAAGNCTIVGPVVGNKIDRRPPTIAISIPSGAAFVLGQSVLSNYTCADGGSGVATCAGTVASATPLDTSSVGPHTFTVTATDAVGNTATSTSTYVVTYGICALFDQTKANKAGSTLPVKLSLCTAAGANVSNAAVPLTATSIYLVSTNAPGPLEDSGNANPDYQFRFTGGFYTFNLSLKGYSMGTYVMTFTAAGDPITHTISFQVK